MRRIAVVGAGPIGLEAAVFARQKGFDVVVFERGTIAENVKQWGHVRLFSPFGLNASNWGREALRQSGRRLPSDDALLTGSEFAETYLIPLSQLGNLAACIHEHTTVHSIGRDRQLKHENIGNSERSQTAFRLLLSDSNGERTELADIVLDCSGTYSEYNHLGTGGIPCIGEREFLQPENYRLPDILGRDRVRFAGRTTLVVGSGYSAATSIVAIGELARSSPTTRAVWLTRNENPRPISEIKGDSLSERRQLTREANRLATKEHGPIDWHGGYQVQGIVGTSDGRIQVIAHRKSGALEDFVIDEILAHVGCRPDRSIYEELQVHECYASQGPMKLAAALLGETSADCLDQAGHGPDTLKNPEPGFFILGAKSYGRNSRFLMKIGIEQIRDVFHLIEETKS